MTGGAGAIPDAFRSKYGLGPPIAFGTIPAQPVPPPQPKSNATTGLAFGSAGVNAVAGPPTTRPTVGQGSNSPIQVDSDSDDSQPIRPIGRKVKKKAQSTAEWFTSRARKLECLRILEQACEKVSERRSPTCCSSLIHVLRLDLPCRPSPTAPCSLVSVVSPT
jgi:hypothetical protein